MYVCHNMLPRPDYVRHRPAVMRLSKSNADYRLLSARLDLIR